MESYRFRHCPDHTCQLLTDNHWKQTLHKWSLLGRINVQKFCFDRHFNLCDKQTFIEEFVRSSAVIENLTVPDSNNHWHSFGGRVQGVRVEYVPCSETTVALLKRVQTAGLVSESGDIQQCAPVWTENGDIITDQLRKLFILPEESDWEDLLSEKEQQQFLWRLFKLVCVGGKLCQYEDNIQQYTSFTTALYKSLISVAKSSGGGGIKVTSHVLEVEAVNERGEAVLPEDGSPHSKLFVCVDPVKREVTTLLHQYGVSL